MSNKFSTKENNMKTIKKYTNRKLYNTETSRYVNLQEILDMIKSGEQVQVLTHKTSTDVTQEVLKEAVFRHVPITSEQLLGMVRNG